MPALVCGGRVKKPRISLLITMLTIIPGGATAADIGAEELASIVKGRKWQVAIAGDLSDPLLQAYWDFNSDGSMCVRFPGSKPNDRCADDGQWKLDGETVCWELKRIGEQYGYKSACVRVQKVNARDYQMHNVKGFRQFLFRPMK
jgi:hypothetical protein